MRVLRTVQEVRAFSDGLWRSGKRLALVPTMGFLHDGHLALMKEGARRADVVAVSIFVNPSQFGPQEDLAKYPRDFEGDVAKCESVGVSVVFAPEPAEVYPPGYQSWLEVEGASRGLDGDKRPGHFRGVATVVAKLLGMFRPHVALFGEKDYQQLQVISALNRDLNLGVEIVGWPTVRESDGLAMSSRNKYLQGEDRQRALALYQGLSAANDAAKGGQRDVATLISLVRAVLSAQGLREDYVEIVHAQTLRPLTTLEDGVPARALVAAFVGTTRLIDNIALAAQT